MGLCARLPRRPSMGICAGRASRVAGKSPGDIARGELSFPPFFGDPKKGGAGAAGARSPRGLAWASLHSALRPRQNTRERCGTLSISTRHATSLQTPESPPERTLAQVGGQLSACPCQARKLVEMGFSAASLSRRGTPRRYGLREMELHDRKVFTSKKGIPLKGLTHTRLLRRFPFWNTAV